MDNAVNDVMKEIRELATKDDRFRARIMRKGGGSIAPGEIVAIFEDVTMEHLGLLEPWVPKLAGAGSYHVYVYHSSDTNRLIGILPIRAGGGPERQIDPEAVVAAVKAPDWRGPTNLIFPDKSKAEASPGVSVPLPSSSGAVPRPPPGGAGEGPFSVYAPPGASKQQVEEAVAAAVAREREIAAKMKELELQKLKLEAQMDARERESKAREDLARVEAEMRALREAVNRPPPPPPPPEKGPSIVEAVQALAPMLMQQMERSDKRQTEMLQLQMENQRQLAQMQAENQRQIAQMQAENSRVQIELLKEQRSDSGDLGKIVSPIIEAMGSMTQMMTQTISVMADLGLAGNQNNEPHPIILGIKEFMRGAALMQKASAEASMQKAQARLPGRTQAMNGANGAAAQTHAPPVQPPQPQPRPEPQQPRAAEPSAVDEIVYLVKNRMAFDERGNPVKNATPKQVATQILHRIGRVAQEMGGNLDLSAFNRIFGERLGDFINAKPENYIFVARVLNEVVNLGADAGLFDDALRPVVARMLAEAEAGNPEGVDEADEEGEPEESESEAEDSGEGGDEEEPDED